jgi:hypothetical protein
MHWRLKSATACRVVASQSTKQKQDHHVTPSFDRAVELSGQTNSGGWQQWPHLLDTLTDKAGQRRAGTGCLIWVLRLIKHTSSTTSY